MAKTGFDTAIAPDESSTLSATPYATFRDALEERTIADVPYVLPHGVFFEGDRLTSFTLKPFKGRTELELSAMVSRFQNKIPEILPLFLPNIIGTIGGEKLEDLAKAQSLSPSKFCERMALADALTILLQARLQEFGSEIQLAGQCPNCGTHNKDLEGEYSDLSTVEMGMLRELPAPLIEVPLKDGVDFLGDRITRVHVRPCRLYDLQRLAKSQGKTAQLRINHELIMRTVVGLPDSAVYSGSDRPISEETVKDFYCELGNSDRARIDTAVKKIGSIGPQMSVGMICRGCGNDDWVASVPWQDLPEFFRVVAEQEDF